MGKNILLLNDRLTGGGAEQILQQIAADLVQRGHRVTIWSPEGNREQLAQRYGAAVRWRRWPLWTADKERWSAGWILQKAVQTVMECFVFRLRRWDAVAAMKEGPCMRRAGRLRAKRKLAWVHTDYQTLHWTVWSFRSDEHELRCMQGFDRVVCVSDAVRRSVIAVVGDPGNLCVRENPIDCAAIRRKAAEETPDALPPGDRPLLVAVGRLHAGKRFDLLLDVCRELARERRFALWIVGGGEEEAALRRQIEDGGLDFARLVGQRDNPYPYIAAADWLVSASESESYGLTVQEAQILGVPVLACACPAIAESLDERCGRLVGLGRDELRDGLREILDHPELGAAAREGIRAHYDAEALGAPRLNAIRELFEE